MAKKKAVDFDDEDAVLADMADALDIDADELKIKDDRSGFSVQAYEVTTRGGREEWRVVASEDDERELALEIVKQDLEQEPEIFEQSFIESHIDTDRLRRDLESDVQSMREEDLHDMAERHPDDFWREYEREGFDAPEEDEDGERREPEDSEIEELAERQTEEQLKDPMEYLRDIYGDDAAKKAIEIAGIDIDAAAEEAVDTDGPAHFLSSYDGQSYTTPGGLVYWRTN
jgi:hypothetical protein